MDSKWEGAHQTSRHPQGPCIGNQLHREDDIAVESSMSEGNIKFNGLEVNVLLLNTVDFNLA
ncbi:hypothetical protein F2Q69_00028074 [Brassica cretica]|uniref:Uncharacterized protein n=1 Tax=Brassica cretica TaxID=69181 RepID=A0A8S9RWS7_BRACR|nr:hypothetical protein F2Q69_00028074 [Brassica cretica]